MLAPAISRSQLCKQLRDLGVEPCSVLLVHTSFSKIKPVEDGPLGLIAVLRLALGPQGTLVMPSMTEDDDHLFDSKTTPCIGMGIVSDMFWRLPVCFAATTLALLLRSASRRFELLLLILLSTTWPEQCRGPSL